jgi:hypothetical protein
MNGFLIALIVVCEVGFWCLLGAGLVARYVLRLRRTSAVLLAGAPVLDLLLLVASVLDLRSGSTAGVAHGLAAVYIGFSVAFGSPTGSPAARHRSGRPGTGRHAPATSGSCGYGHSSAGRWPAACSAWPSSRSTTRPAPRS